MFGFYARRVANLVGVLLLVVSWLFALWRTGLF